MDVKHHVYLLTRETTQSSGAVWKSRWPSWAPVPNKPTVSVDVKQHSTSQPSWDYHDDPLGRWGLFLNAYRCPTPNIDLFTHTSTSKCLLPAPLTWSHTRRFQRRNTQICYHFELCDKWHKDCCLSSTPCAVDMYTCVCSSRGVDTAETLTPLFLA